MQKITRRGLASFGVAALLVLAPITATAAYADDEVAVVDAPAEVVAEAPAEVVAEETAPAEVVADAPADPIAEEVPLAEVTPTADPVETLVADAQVASTPAARAAGSLIVHGASGAPISLSVASNVLTASWAPTSDGAIYGYYWEIYDYRQSSYTTSDWYGSAMSFSAPLTSGGHYYAYYADGHYGNYVDFTYLAPAPNAPTTVTADRLPTADGFSLSWAAPVENTENPVTSYSIDVTTGESTSTVTTSDLSYDFTELPVGVNSTFAVTAIAADGQVSAPATTDATLEAIAPTVPQNPMLTRTGDTLSGTWAAPAYDGGSPIDSYVVGLFADGVEVKTLFGLTDTSVTFSVDADYSVEYSFLIIAITEAGLWSPTGESNTVVRPDFAPSTPAAYASTDAYKNPMVNVYWEFVNQEGSQIESVTVTLYDETGAVSKQETHTVLDGRSNVPFYELANDTTYTATVVATNAAGSSAESAPVEIRTNGLVPPAYTAEEVALAGNFSNVTAALTGSELVAHIDGLTAGDWVFAHAYSTPSALGWAQVDAAGNARWSISGAGLATGATHTLAVQNSFGELLGSATFSIAAPAVATAALAHTGTDSFSWIAIALAMLVVGAISTATKVRRRARA